MQWTISRWHKGWRASLPIHKDAIGLMYLDPSRAGHFETDLIFDGGFEMLAARSLSAITAVLLIGACIRNRA